MQLFVLGLQGSGKTTFVAALWYLLDSNTGGVATKLIKGLHQGDFAYLEKISKVWANGWQIERSATDTKETASINLLDKQGQELVLSFTDLSGESFEKIFATRRCSSDLPPLITESVGLLLFVSARRKVDDYTILDFKFKPEGEASNNNPPPEKEPKFDPAKVPHQVQLVDLLRSLRERPFYRKTLRIAVIVSAWDLARVDTPDLWLERTMPLLAQHLKGNTDTIEFQVYGVSAQGVELPKVEDGTNADRNAALQIENAAKRIKVVGPNCGLHDITCPIGWVGQVAEDAATR